MTLSSRTPRRLASWMTPSLWKRFHIQMKTIHLRSMQKDMNIKIFRSQCWSAQVEEVVEAISEAVSSEIETELINAGHTNVLLLRQVIFISYIHTWSVFLTRQVIFIFHIYTCTVFLLRQLKKKSAFCKKENTKRPNSGVWPGWKVAPQPWHWPVRVGEQVIRV